MIRIPLLLALLLTPLAAFAASLQSLPVGGGLTLEFTLPAPPWELTTTPPAYLVEETVHHLGHELEGQGKRVDAEQLRSFALKRLAANEGYVCNPASGACLTIDFSPLREGERAPSASDIRGSAAAAGESMSSEEGMSQVRAKTRSAALAGARHVARLDIEFLRHGEPARFIGLIGYAAPSWFFLYYTDPLKVATDLAQMEAILASMKVVPGR